MNTTFKFNNVKELDKAIDQVILGASNLKAMIQGVGLGIVAHAAGKGNYNVTRAKKLVDGLGAGFKQDSLVAWFEVVGIEFDDEGNVSLNKKKLIPENMAKLKSKPWYEYKKTNPYQGFDLEAKVKAMLTSAYKAAAKEGPEAELVKIDPELLGKLEALIPAAERPKKPAKAKLTVVGKQSKPVRAKDVQTKATQAA